MTSGNSLIIQQLLISLETECRFTSIKPIDVSDLMIAVVQCAHGVLIIRFFGSHEEYDKVDADHAQAKALIGMLMESKDPTDQARMVAQAYPTEAYERSRWPRRVPSLPDLLTCLMDQHGLSRGDLIPLLRSSEIAA